MSQKTPQSTHQRSWPNVYSRKRRSGQVGYIVGCIVDLGLINDKRERHSFNTKTAAAAFAELKKTERKNQGTAALALFQEIKVDGAKASALLTPHGPTTVRASRRQARGKARVAQAAKAAILDAKK